MKGFTMFDALIGLFTGFVESFSGLITNLSGAIIGGGAKSE